MKKNVNQNNDEILKLIKVVIAVALIFIIFVIITIIVSNKKENRINYDVPESKIDFKEILVGNMLKQNPDEYYVLALKEDDPYYGLYNRHFEKIIAENEDFKYYIINLDGVFNRKYTDEKSNLTISDIADIKFSKETIIKISKKKIVSTFEGYDAIVEHLSSLVK